MSTVRSSLISSKIRRGSSPRPARVQSWAIVRPELGQPVALRSPQGGVLHLLVLRESDALRALPVRLGGHEHLVRADDDLWPEADGFMLTGNGTAAARLEVYPPPSRILAEGREVSGGADGAWWRADSPLPKVAEVPVAAVDCFRPAADAFYPYAGDTAALLIRRLELPADVFAAHEEAELAIRWAGDTARLYCDGQLVGDRFWDGSAWRLRLGRWRERLLSGAVLVLVISPWPRDTPVHVEAPPVFDDDRRARLDAVTLRREPRCRVWAKG